MKSHVYKKKLILPKLEISLLNSDLREQNSLLNEKIKKIGKLTDDLKLTQTANRQFQKCIESKTTRIVELEKTIVDKTEKYKQVDEEIEKLIAENYKIRSEIDYLVANNENNSKDEIYKLNKEIKNLKESLQKSHDEYEELDDEYEDLENDLAEAGNKLKDRDNEIEIMKKQISELKERNAVLAQDAEYKTDFKNLYNKFITFKNNYSNNEKERFAAQERVNELTNNVVSLTSQIKEQECTITQLEADKRSYSDTLNSQKELIERISTDMDTFKNSNLNLKRILEVKEKDITNLEDLITEYKAELDKPMKYREEYKNLVKDKEYLSKQNENIKHKFNEVKKSFDKFVWNTQEKNKMTTKQINQLKKNKVDPEIVMQDIDDFYDRMVDTYSYYHGQYKKDKNVMTFLNESKLLINDVLQYMELKFGNKQV